MFIVWIAVTLCTWRLLTLQCSRSKDALSQLLAVGYLVLPCFQHAATATAVT